MTKRSAFDDLFFDYPLAQSRYDTAAKFIPANQDPEHAEGALFYFSTALNRAVFGDRGRKGNQKVALYATIQGYRPFRIPITFKCWFARPTAVLPEDFEKLIRNCWDETVVWSIQSHGLKDAPADCHNPVFFQGPPVAEVDDYVSDASVRTRHGFSKSELGIEDD